MSIPYWRKVNYTDDGCSIYQCLNCYNQWEGRSPPGWYKDYEHFPYPVEGANGRHHQDRNGVRIDTWYRKLENPIYKPYWKFCPCCRIEWKEAVRCGVDNERMLGSRRLSILNKILKRESSTKYTSSYWFNAEPRWYWVVQKREIWPDRDEPEKWSSQYKHDPWRNNALSLHKTLQYEREQCLAEDAHSKELFGVKHEVRVVKMDAKDCEHTYNRH